MRTHNNKKARKSRPYFFKPMEVFIGTNIVPLGQLKAERQSKAVQAVQNYEAKVKEWIQKGKKGQKPKFQYIKLRIDFIEFVRSKRKSLEKPLEHYERDLTNHMEEVVNYCDRVQRQWDNKPNHDDTAVCRSSPVYIKTSRRIVCGD